MLTRITVVSTFAAFAHVAYGASAPQAAAPVSIDARFAASGSFTTPQAALLKGGLTLKGGFVTPQAVAMQSAFSTHGSFVAPQPLKLKGGLSVSGGFAQTGASHPIASNAATPASAP